MNKKPIVIGKFGAAHGVHGWIKVYSYTDPHENLFDLQPWRVKRKHSEHTYQVSNKKSQQDHFLVKLEGVDTPEDAKLLTNALILTERNQLPDTDGNQFYWSDLEGLTVVTQDGVQLGQVDHIFETGANDILAVKDENQTERLIPYIKDVVISVDLERQVITVNWDPEF